MNKPRHLHARSAGLSALEHASSPKGKKMSAYLRLSIYASIALTTLGLAARQVNGQTISTSFVPVTFQTSGATTTTSVTGGQTFYATKFNPTGTYSSLIFLPTDGGNWSQASAFTIDVKSNMSYGIVLVIRIVDSTGVEYDGKATLVPGKEYTICLPFSPIQPNSFGMSSSPPLIKYLASNAQQVTTNSIFPATAAWISPSHVASIKLQTFASGAPVYLSFGQPQIQISGANTGVYNALVDTFGQSTLSTWPEKVSSLSDMQTSDNAETQQLRQWTADRTDLDAFGGTKSVVLKNGTGYFRTYYSNGRWWLVTPEGHGFFQLGVDVVDIENGYTITSNRTSMFQDIANQRSLYPNWLTPVASKPGFEYFNFYGANLQKKWGTATDATSGLPNYLAQFKARADWRLEAWRFNTVGWISNVEFYRHTTLPTVFGLKVKSYFTGATVAGSTNHWGAMIDPFDPTYVTAVTNMVNGIPDYLIKNNYLIGYFVDNELPWGDDQSNDYHALYALPVNTLGLSGDTSPAKRVFFNQLYKQYGTVAALSQAWGITISSWDQLWKPFTGLPATANATLQSDLNAFLKRYADEYYSTIKIKLKYRDPNHLYLGSRFAQKPATVVTESQKYTDLTSINFYAYTPLWYQTAAIKSMAKPVLISEFHFGSTDRGPFWPGIIDSGSEANRGPFYTNYMNAMAGIPNVVGCDWYQYLDEPTAGEFSDKANGHIGLISVADTPYQDFLTQARQANINAASVHASSK
jgi:hypothetical protein